MSLNDAMFFLGESPGKPAHVIALQLFRPVGDLDLSELYDELLTLRVKPAFARKPVRSLRSATTMAWADDDLDLDYHVRHVALPARGRIRELLELVSLEHGVVLDRNRPPWEFHLVEGLRDGRFATTFKTHHGLADGMTLARHMLASLSPDRDRRDCLPPWAQPDPEPEAPADRRTTTRASAGPGARARYVQRSVVATAKAVGALRSLAGDALGRVPYEAPRSILNQPLTGARRFAGDHWSYPRLKAVAAAADCQVNDVALAMCGGALRAYLTDLRELPEASLISMVPISLRRDRDEFDAESGNAFGAILCDLRTTTVSAAERLAGIASSMVRSKELFAGLGTAEAIALSRIIMGGAAVGSMTPALAPERPPFNLIVSNVPASPVPLYFNGSEMTDIYPVSMISERQGMNITVTRYADTMTFGIVGDRRHLPSLQRMLIHLEDALAQLEAEILG
ncbi:MAG: wax ester/triacylglycerol synthase family O-acyltransferase [Nocardioides sp.]|uniref:wax ester/triacylglycerol synthase family O-acyltransferase n=1 Tax=Nocardioides sp. TaxID=35761 RepID=UPI0039E56595